MSKTTHLTKRQVVWALTQYMEQQLGYGQGRVEIEDFSFPKDKPGMIAIVCKEVPPAGQLSGPVNSDARSPVPLPDPSDEEDSEHPTDYGGWK